MNDKQQRAAMGEQLTAMGERLGAQYRLTEEQAKGLAERMPQTGALQVIDDEPMCMAKRIEDLEAQVDRAERALIRSGFTYTEGAEEWKSPLGPSARPFIEKIDALEALLAEARYMMDNQPRGFSGMIKRIDASLAGKLPEPVIFMSGCSVGKTTSITAVPEGWQLVPKEPTDDMFVVGGERLFDCVGPWEGDDDTTVKEQDWAATIYRAMLSAAPSPDGAK